MYFYPFLRRSGTRAITTDVSDGWGSYHFYIYIVMRMAGPSQRVFYWCEILTTFKHFSYKTQRKRTTNMYTKPRKCALKCHRCQRMKHRVKDCTIPKRKKKITSRARALGTSVPKPVHTNQITSVWDEFPEIPR